MEPDTKTKPNSMSSPYYGFLPVDIEGFESLVELALDMRWSWNHAADDLWTQLDPVLWELTHNPWLILQTVSRDRLRNFCADALFRTKVEALVRERQSRHEYYGSDNTLRVWGSGTRPDDVHVYWKALACVLLLIIIWDKKRRHSTFLFLFPAALVVLGLRSNQAEPEKL
jgi:hypothetical protein